MHGSGIKISSKQNEWNEGNWRSRYQLHINMFLCW